MKSAEPKSAAISTIQKKSNTPFFDTEHASEQESPFFAPQEASGTDAFFQPTSRPIIQTKLTVGQPNDKYEQEADNVADKVVQRLAKTDNDSITNPKSETRNPKSNTPSVSEASTPIVQHKTDAPEEEKLDRKEESKEELPELQKSPVSAVGDDEGLQMKCAACEAEEESGHVQMKGNTEGVASSNIESQLNSSRGGGSPLPDETRTSMESAMGADFSNVRVHTGSNAIQMSQDLNAQAFTHGSDVYFNEGKYNPSGTEGGRLLAHELVHTQQQGEIYRKIQRNCNPALASCSPQPTSTCNPANSSCPTLMPITSSEFANTGDPDLDRYSDNDIAQVGVFSLGSFLNNSANVVEPIRILYNRGVDAIKLVRADMLRLVLPSQSAESMISQIANIAIEEEAAMARQLERVMTREAALSIARRVSDMRHALALDTRRASGTILQKGAELVDLARGQARPTMDSLVRSGKSPYRIMLSATRTNGFINALPRVLRWTGRGLWIVSAGMSIYTIVNASEEDRARVTQEEIGGFVGGGLGMAIGEGICLLAAPETAGLSLLACGILGGMVGGSLGRNRSFLEFIDLAPHRSAYEEGRIYRLEGAFDETDLFIVSIINRDVLASEHVLVIATGTVSGEMVSGRGHYRQSTVVPANQPAVNLFGNNAARRVPQYLLHPVSNEDLVIP